MRENLSGRNGGETFPINWDQTPSRECGDCRNESGSFMREPALAGLVDVLHRATGRFRPGDTLGVYKVLALVGSGGMDI